MKNIKILILSILLIFGPKISLTQIPSKIWYFGNNAGIDFNFNPPLKIQNGNHYIDEGGVTVTDENGDLLFYVDENTVYNRFNLAMKNGTNLIGNSGSSAQSPIALQDLSNSNLIYIFYVSDHITPSLIGQMRYSVIDLCGDEGKGEILDDKKNILVPGKYTERLTACYDSINNRYWILCSDFNTHNIIAFELNSSGLNLNGVVSFLDVSSKPTYIGMIVFNNENTKVIYTCGLSNEFNGAILGKFDINSGKVSDAQIIFTGDIYDAVFSESGRYIYLTDIFRQCNLIKLDLNDRSKDKVILTREQNYSFVTIEKGPDGNIYLAMFEDNSVGRITNSDSENELFDPGYFKFSGNQKVNFGLQSTNFFFGIINETIIAKELGNDTIVCGDINIVLNSGLEKSIWADGSIGETQMVTSPGIYYYYFRDCGTLYSDTINIRFESEILKTENQKLALCRGDSIFLEGSNPQTEWSNGQISERILIKESGEFWAKNKEGCLTVLKNFNISIDTLLQKLGIKDTTYCIDEPLNINIPFPYKLLDLNRNEVNLNLFGQISGQYIVLGQNACGAEEETFEVIVERYPNLLTDTILVCSITDFPVALNTSISNTLWENNIIDSTYMAGKAGKYNFHINNTCGDFSGEFLVMNTDLNILPNIFSPNGNGLNDFFPGIDLKSSFVLEIYDRWGNLVYFGYENWDGTWKGRNVDQGVYVYAISPLQCQGYKYFGTVTLIR